MKIKALSKLTSSRLTIFFFKRKRLLLIFSVTFLFIAGFSQNTGLKVEVIPRKFKILIPFEINNKGIIIKTFWGSDKILNELLWDNNSPTWLNTSGNSKNNSIQKSKNFSYATTTADGTPISGSVFICDSIRLGTITFTNISFYEIPSKMKGVFGENLVAQGIWEINFKKKLIIFTSNIDSLEDKKDAQLLSTDFLNNSIKINIGFSNKTMKKVQLDFGFNGGILLPYSDFLEVTKGNTKTYSKELQFSTPSSYNICKNTMAFDTILIQNKVIFSLISTNNRVTEKLIGLSFFEKFEFVIFDYVEKKFFVSKTKG